MFLKLQSLEMALQETEDHSLEALIYLNPQRCKSPYVTSRYKETEPFLDVLSVVKHQLCRQTIGIPSYLHTRQLHLYLIAEFEWGGRGKVPSSIMWEQTLH